MNIIDFNDVLAQKKKDENFNVFYDEGMEVLSKLSRDDAEKIVRLVMMFLYMEGYRNGEIRSKK